MLPARLRVASVLREPIGDFPEAALPCAGAQSPFLAKECEQSNCSNMETGHR